MILLLWAAVAVASYTPGHVAGLRNRTKALFQHGWDSYMSHGFPYDEVRPISCQPYGPQFSQADSLENDVLGNVSLTLLDNLDTLLVMGQWDAANRLLVYLEAHQAGFFDQDHVIQVFEALIRWLGGLLLGHLALVAGDLGPGPGRTLQQQYLGFLLDMAYDLGLRLIEAFNTPTKIPVPRINLAKGVRAVPTQQNRENCAAGATTPYLEFTLLLKLTGDPRFHELANGTFHKVWGARLQLGLVPMTVDVGAGRWADIVTGTGALIDLLFEHAQKSAILFGDEALYDVWKRLYHALVTHLAFSLAPDAWTVFTNVVTLSGQQVTQWIDSLLAFFPGLQVLGGQVSAAVSLHTFFLKLWNTYDGLPERWELAVGSADSLPVSLEWYPLRPEFIELAYYLYRATADPIYLHIGVRALHLLETRYKFPCGFAGYQDVRTGEFQDRMETFVLGELLKYLYLLFDVANESYVHRERMRHTNWVFTTEAHPVWYSEKLGRRSRTAFRHKLSTVPTAEIRWATPTILGSMWRGFTAHLGEINVEVNDNSVFEYGAYPSHLEPALSYLDTCEVGPRQWAPNGAFASSGFYQWDHAYLADHQFGLLLERPAHMPGNVSVELDPQFMGEFGLASPGTCARAPTAPVITYLIGKSRRPEQYEIYRVKSPYTPGSNVTLHTADIVMPTLGGSVKAEKLVVGNIDMYNSDITPQFIRRVAGDKLLPEVFRIHEINGYTVGQDAVVWTHKESVADDLYTEIAGGLMIQGQLFINLRVF